MEETLYNTLKVEEDAPPEIIRAAYKVLSGMYHPDKHSSAEANELMQKINNAYRILRDPEMRARYDESLRKARSQATEQQQPPESSEPAPAQETAKPRASIASSAWSTWLPIIVCVIAGRLLGLVGALSALGVYYWVKPRKGVVVASIAAIFGGLATTLAAAAFLQVQQQGRQVTPVSQAPAAQLPSQQPRVEDRIDPPANTSHLDPLDIELAIVDGSHPGWRQKVQSPEFMAWLSRQDQYTQNTFYKTERADDVLTILSQYDRWITTSRQQAQAERDRPRDSPEKVDRILQQMSDWDNRNAQILYGNR